ncbi:type II and III secretion system protein family protein [Azospirillum sp. SYSU D00513]|uniref:type II and III secretion system protein family protein n=1 Tax=Azospirillum sp. SYSU D00513 TaxID=2812561 RepID=UPI001A95FAEB|nr:type II and III secretion system protein family protein [Azospirillum sp. SYSU D00513]
MPGLREWGLRGGFSLCLACLAAVFSFAPFPAAAQAPIVALSGDRQIELTTTKAVMVSLPADASDVLIADPAVAEIVIKTPRLAYLIGVKPGDTNAFFLDANGRRLLSLDIRVEKDLSALRKAISDLMPDAAINIRSLNGDVVLSGEVGSSEMAEDARRLARRFVENDAGVINMLRVGRPEQVLIQVRVTEMRRSVAKRLGISLGARGRGVSGDFFQSGIPGGSGVFLDQFSQALVTGNIGGFLNLSAMIEALESDGYIKTLAEPNLTAMSGESANFLAGGEFPIPVARDDNGNITLEFKPFGVSLKFTPVVLDGGRVSMRIATEVSALSSEGAFRLADIEIPGLTVRRAETAVEIPSGGSLVLGGLLRNDSSNQLRGLPALADLPIIGALFRSSEFLSDQSELVVIAVPYIVRPTGPQRLSDPARGFQETNDLNRYFFGKLYQRYPAAAQKRPAVAAEGAGYILDWKQP